MCRGYITDSRLECNARIINYSSYEASLHQPLDISPMGRMCERPVTFEATHDRTVISIVKKLYHNINIDNLPYKTCGV